MKGHKNPLAWLVLAIILIATSGGMVIYAGATTTIEHRLDLYWNGTALSAPLYAQSGITFTAYVPKAGYTFHGWYLDAELTNQFDGIINRELSLHAKYTTNFYKVTLIDPSGQFAPQSRDFEFTTSFSFADDFEIPTHLAFLGIHNTMFANNFFSPSNSIDVPSQNMTFYMQWSPLFYPYIGVNVPNPTINERILIRYDINSPTDFIAINPSSNFRNFANFTWNTQNLFTLENLNGTNPSCFNKQYYKFDGWNIAGTDIILRDGETLDLNTLAPESFTNFIITGSSTFMNITTIRLITLTATWSLH
jgi:uncharacterized repeat protein (TIGR02543 family)